jgi:hypothetical protein
MRPVSVCESVLVDVLGKEDGNKMTTKISDAETQLGQFIAKFESAHQALIRATRRILQRRFPTANELVYDNYNFFVIGYASTERPSDAFLSIAAAANGVGLCFIRGASLPDPQKLLTGSGKQTRFLRIPAVEVLKGPEVQALLGLAADQSKVPLPAAGRGRLIIRSVSAKQRPRRRAKTPPG